MKIQIDTNAKTIKVEGRVKLADLFDQLQKFFPNGEWEEYEIETDTAIYSTSPYQHNYPYFVSRTALSGTSNITTSSTAIIDDSFSGTITNCGTSTVVYDSAIFNIESN